MLSSNSGISFTSNCNTTSETQQVPRASNHNLPDKTGISQIISTGITYAPKDCGGIGLRLFGSKQGLHKILQFLKHTQRNTSIGKVYGIVIQHYQRMSGLMQLVLQDTQTLPWSNAPWFDTACQFLKSIQSQVILHDLWTTPRWWQHDRHIMDDILGLNLPKTQAIQLQSVWLYLWVTVLSEITNHSGTHIQHTKLTWPKNWHTHYKDDSSSSTLQWPH